jgi:hypothetical protein
MLNRVRFAELSKLRLTLKTFYGEVSIEGDSVLDFKNMLSSLGITQDDYATIAAAISHANDGDTVFVKAGVHEEKTLEINKTLSLIGEGAESTTVNLSPELRISFPPNLPPDLQKLETSYHFDPSIEVNANGFRLEGFTINTPNIVDFKRSSNISSHNLGGDVLVTGNETEIVGNIIACPLLIKGSYLSIQENNLLEDSNVIATRSKIIENSFFNTIWASGTYLNISSNNCKESRQPLTAQWGIHVEGSFCIISNNNLADRNLYFGVDVTGNGNIVATNVVEGDNEGGVRIEGSGNIVCANRITNNNVGLEVLGNNTVYANDIANNEIGLMVNLFQTNDSSVFFHNNFMNNTQQVAIDRKARDIFGNGKFDNGEEGNYWSNYAGEDADGNGIGDSPYVIDDKRQDRYPLMVAFNIESVIVPLPNWASSGSVTAEPFPVTALVAVSAAAITVVLCISLVAYFRRLSQHNS